MPPPGHSVLTVHTDIKEQIDRLVIDLAAKHRIKYTMSSAIQAAIDSIRKDPDQMPDSHVARVTDAMTPIEVVSELAAVLDPDDLEDVAKDILARLTTTGQ